MTTRDDDKLLKLKQQRSKEAIAMAMQARWNEAVELNSQLLELFPEDVDSYNRLGRAYLELGQYAKAREAYRKAQEIDPYNAIAARNLRRLNDLSDTDTDEVETDRVEPQHFIEEIGKAGVVGLYDLAAKEVRAKIVAGDRVTLKQEGHELAVYSSRGVYTGKVDLKYAQRLVRLIIGGNQYTASVVKSSAEAVTVIIRETYQHPSQAGKLSFPPKGMEEFRTYASDRKAGDDEEDEDESGYTIVGGEDGEEMPDISDGMDDADGDDE
jgi:tetratricopeptide (TPR) repeat protein